MRITHVLTLIFVTALWGLNCVLSKIGMRDFPPLFYSTLRFILMAPALFFVPRPKVSWMYILALSLFWGVIQFSCLNSAINMGTSVSLCSLIFQSSTFFSMLFSSLLLKERPTVFQLVGILIGLVGISLIGWNADKSITLIGFFLAMTAAASWGFGNVLLKKIGTDESFRLMIWTNALPAFPMLLLAIAAEGQKLGDVMNQTFPLQAMGCALYSSLAAVLIGGALWMRLIQNYSVNQITGFSLLVPFFAILFSWPLLGESLTLYNIMAGGFIVVGLLISQCGSQIPIRLRMGAIVNSATAEKVKVSNFQKLPHYAED